VVEKQDAGQEKSGIFQNAAYQNCMKKVSFGLAEWLKWKSACLARVTWSSNPVPAKEKRNSFLAEHRLHMPINLSTQEAKIRGLWFKTTPGKIVLQTLSQKYSTPRRTAGVA
jgi:hypothetical protein